MGAPKAACVLNLRQLKVNIKQAGLKPSRMFYHFPAVPRSPPRAGKQDSSHEGQLLKGLKPCCWIQMTDLLFPGVMARGVGHSPNSN